MGIDVPSEICFILLLLRVLPWWRRSGHAAAGRLPVPIPQILHWLIYPLAIWFLWPKRLGAFLSYVSVGQHGQVAEFSPWIGSVPYYFRCSPQDYHANSTSLWVAIFLLTAAFIGLRRCERGSAAVFIVLAVAFLLTNYHISNRARFLHSWLAIGWSLAGVGAANIIARVGDFSAGMLRAPIPSGGGSGVVPLRFRLLKPTMIVGMCAALARLQGPALLAARHAQ